MAQSFWAHFGLLAHFDPFFGHFWAQKWVFFKFEAYIRNQRVFAVILSINMSKKIFGQNWSFSPGSKIFGRKFFFLVVYAARKPCRGFSRAKIDRSGPQMVTMGPNRRLLHGKRGRFAWLRHTHTEI